LIDQYTQHSAVAGFDEIGKSDISEKALLWSYLEPHMANICARFGSSAAILDYGCGTGWFAHKAQKLLSGQGGRVAGYDPSPEMVEKAGENNVEGAILLTTDLNDLRPRDYHAVAANFVIPAIPTTAELVNLFTLMKGFLADGGRLYVSTADIANIHIPHDYFICHPTPGQREGTPYKTDILDGNGNTVVTVEDILWTEETIVRIAAESGLTPRSTTKLYTSKTFQKFGVSSYAFLEFET